MGWFTLWSSSVVFAPRETRSFIMPGHFCCVATINGVWPCWHKILLWGTEITWICWPWAFVFAFRDQHSMTAAKVTESVTLPHWTCIDMPCWCVGMLQSCNQGHMTFRKACLIQSWHCTMWQRYSECTLSRCSSSIVGLPCVCDTFHGRMHTCRNSLHHLERWDLRHENAEEPQLPFLCLHHRNSPPSAVVVCPADILFSN